jgi:hypothetical protein
MSNGFQMLRIGAGAIPAKMVNLKFARIAF